VQNLLSLTFTPDAPFNRGRVDHLTVTALLQRTLASQAQVYVTQNPSDAKDPVGAG
jgi:hypothetical protein